MREFTTRYNCLTNSIQRERERERERKGGVRKKRCRKERFVSEKMIQLSRFFIIHLLFRLISCKFFVLPSCAIEEVGNVTKSELLYEFRLIRPLGKGTFGEVVHVQSKSRPRCHYAMKKFTPQYRSQGKHEAKILSMLSGSPYFPIYYGCILLDDRENAPVFVFMECVGKYSLLEVLDSVS